MPSVAELSDPYANFMVSPRRRPGVCELCFNFTRGFRRCYACEHNDDWLAAVDPISYSVGLAQLHRALMGYKRLGGEVSRRLTVELAAVLWRHLARHERCIASAAEVGSFELVTTVPSGDPERDHRHPMKKIVSELVGPTRERYARLLRRSSSDVGPRLFDPNKFEAVRPLAGEAVLLVDDTWTTGASAQSAASALRGAGAGPIGAVVVGRHLNREWHDTERRLGAMSGSFDWDRCALCAWRVSR